LRRQALRWCEDNLKTLSTADPAVPDPLNDRAADNWRPLLAVADRAGGEWPKRARDAALILSGDSVEGGSIRTQLLADIRPLLNDQTIKGLTSEAIIAELVKKPDGPWADWKNGKAITRKALTGLAQTVRDIPASVVGWRRQGTEGVCPPCPRKCVLLLPTPSSMCRCVGNATAAGTSSLFNVSANPLTETLKEPRKPQGQWRGRHIDTLKRPREPKKKTDGEKRQSARPPAGVKQQSGWRRLGGRGLRHAFLGRTDVIIDCFSSPLVQFERDRMSGFPLADRGAIGRLSPHLLHEFVLDLLRCSGINALHREVAAPWQPS
jgi:hypothetical protein